MIPQIITGITITGITITGVFIGIRTVFFSKCPKYDVAYSEIAITEYHELKWYDSSDSGEE